MDLTLEEDFIDLIFEHAQIDDFDGDWLTIFIVAAFVDVAGVAFSDCVGESI